MGRYIAGTKGREVLVGSDPARSSTTALCFGVAAAHYSLGDRVAIRSGIGYEFGVDVVYVISVVELGSDVKLPCETG